LFSLTSLCVTVTSNPDSDDDDTDVDSDDELVILDPRRKIIGRELL